MREVSLHDALRLLRPYVDTPESWRLPGETPTKRCWAPGHQDLGTICEVLRHFPCRTALLRAIFMALVRSSGGPSGVEVMPDHLLSAACCEEAQLLGRGLEGLALQRWLQQHSGERVVKGVRGVACHFVAVEELETVAELGVVEIRAGREHDEVSFQGTKLLVPLELQEPGTSDGAYKWWPGLLELLKEQVLVTLLRCCRQLHVTELRCTLASRGQRHSARPGHKLYTQEPCRP